MNAPRLIEQRYAVTDSAEFGRVAVMLGGNSSERDVSLDSGAAVLEALQAKGVDAHPWDPAEKSMAEFATAGFDRAWIALHGPGGEDGALQGLLQWLEIPYTGSGVMASAVAMDKVRSKHLFRAAGIPTPDYAVVRTRDEASVAAEQVGFPLIIKPSGQGSSVGMSKVFERAELNDAVELAMQYGDTVLLETCVTGGEFTVAVLQGKALPTIRIVTPRVFYGTGGQHGAGHDQPQPGAHGCEARRDRFRGTVLAHSRDKFRGEFGSGHCGGPSSWHVSKPNAASRRRHPGSGCRRSALAALLRRSWRSASS
jgi:D-alanine-D-alanine ligase